MKSKGGLTTGLRPVIILTDRSVSMKEDSKTRRHGTQARARILDEAEHLIHLHGFQGTSLEEIASRCKMTKANLLHHFRSKEELGLAVLDYKIDCYRRRSLESLFAPGRAPREAVADLFAKAASLHRENGCRAGCFIGNIALEMSDLNPRFRERAAAFFEEWTVRLAGLLERPGRPPARPPRETAEAVLSLYEGAVMLSRARRDPEVFDRVGRAALALVDGFPADTPQPKLKGR